MVNLQVDQLVLDTGCASDS